ncbi:hypothetical protein [Mycobacteroides chelonae]|uniref:hypothetical protein n=1 Tax=Mycobacteroides chelonae TaxID=1774 RepID=UPI0008AA0F8E|nr:hypothetical protein [Mycobacteroides chelonae]MBV0920693.1 hypothetical protein [Mycobacteroides chelonae]OHT57308.1 hypothetical protein BKG63_01990 [Mycobacteroides chelonae]OHT96806.1 hypothetical protein BKG72_11770 [Mycobacteroides chelonae]OLT93878.1 hypothetical protein BKG59_04100 [Mycobacteroides chelonae]GLE59813.1 hypothetical protein NJBCHELONAE_51290 [Mycobacteroides chelonae]
MKISDMTQAQQIEHLVSKRDRTISIYRQTGNPQYKNGRELIAIIDVAAEPNGDISIGIGSTGPLDDIDVQFTDDGD